MRVENPRSNQTQGTDTARQTAKTGKAAVVEQAKEAQRGGAASGAQASVNFDISAKGKEFAKAKAVAGEAPDVREAKVAELKRRIAEGKYKVDNHAVADRMVDDHLKMGGLD